MSSKAKTVGLWVLAVVITLLAVVFQRMTGPTNPKKVGFELSGTEYKTRLPRSLETPAKPNVAPTEGGCELSVKIAKLPADVQLTFYVKRYRTNDEWIAIPAVREGDKFNVALPVQPVAGKLCYYMLVEQGGQQQYIQKDEPIVVRFKGNVSPYVLIPHILLMFIAMLFSNVAGLFALAKRDSYLKYAKTALVCLGLGGLVFGGFVQLQAFGTYWAGWPLGGDLTDNKTLISFILWLVAVLLGIKKRRYIWAVIAAVFVLMVYCIPHSTLGSEYDHSKGEITTGTTANE